MHKDLKFQRPVIGGSRGRNRWFTAVKAFLTYGPNNTMQVQESGGDPPVIHSKTVSPVIRLFVESRSAKTKLSPVILSLSPQDAEDLGCVLIEAAIQTEGISAENARLIRNALRRVESVLPSAGLDLTIQAG
jgi:hypothetical protein